VDHKLLVNRVREELLNKGLEIAENLTILRNRLLRDELDIWEEQG